MVYIWYIWYLYMFIISPPFQHVNHRGFLSLKSYFQWPMALWSTDRRPGRSWTHKTMSTRRSQLVDMSVLPATTRRGSDDHLCDPWNPWNLWKVSRLGEMNILFKSWGNKSCVTHCHFASFFFFPFWNYFFFPFWIFFWISVSLLLCFSASLLFSASPLFSAFLLLTPK